MNYEGFGRKLTRPNRCTIPEFAWNNWGKQGNILVRVADVPAEI
jgi:hypothetical protein